MELVGLGSVRFVLMHTEGSWTVCNDSATSRLQSCGLKLQVSNTPFENRSTVWKLKPCSQSDFECFSSHLNRFIRHCALGYTRQTPKNRFTAFLQRSAISASMLIIAPLLSCVSCLHASKLLTLYGQ